MCLFFDVQFGFQGALVRIVEVLKLGVWVSFIVSRLKIGCVVFGQWVSYVGFQSPDKGVKAVGVCA